MVIDEVETFVLKLTAGEPYLGSFGGNAEPSGYVVREPWRSLYSGRYETLLVKLVARDGTTGWGEALAPVGPEVPAAVVDVLLAPVLRGADASRPRPVWFRLRELMRERGHLTGHQADALAAVDIALWDLAGRLAGRSVAEMLGGAFRDELLCYVSGLPRSTDEERADLAKEWAERGARAVKLHLGRGVKADLATVAVVREAAPSLRVAADAHWAYRIDDALRLANGLANAGCWFLESPLAPEDVAGHAELVSRSPLPVAIGETLRNRFELTQWLDARALRIAQPDIGRTGITEAMAFSELCAARHVPVAPHHSVGLGIAMAAGVQASAAMESFEVFEFQPSSVEVGVRILTEEMAVRPDRIAVPGGPGLGVEVDEQAVYQLSKER